MSDFRHQTDRSEALVIAECPESDGTTDHLVLQATCESTDEDAEEFIEELKEIWPDCGCGRELNYISQTEPTEVLD